MCGAACPCGAGILPLSHSVSRFARAWGAGTGGHGACLEGKVDRVIRLVASDMDGTLLDEGSQVPPEMFDLIKRLTSVGHPVAMGNGRYAVKQVAERVIGMNAEHAVQAELASLIESAGEERPPIPDLF